MQGRNSILSGLLAGCAAVALLGIGVPTVTAQTSGLPTIPRRAATPPATPTPAKKEPVMLSANELGYDRAQALVVALGEVEVVQGETIVLADRITYNQNTGEVFANGNVSVRQPNGDVYFADNVKLKDDLRAGVVRDFRARLSDNSLFAAREGRKVNEKITELDYAVYSPCKLCDDKDPLWQIKAEDVTIDDAEKQITYENASLEFWGLPVFWTPYLSHATPDAPGKPGILTPEYGADSILGTILRVPVYAPLASNMDITLTPVITSKEGPMLFGEFRHLVEDGFYQFRGSITNPEKRAADGSREFGREIRGHIDAFGNFELNPTWNWGFQIQRATDDTYLRRYDISDADTLTSRLFLEGIDGRQYASAQTIAFQGLEETDDPDRSPLILPLMDYQYESTPGWMGSRWNIGASTQVITRDLGPESRRLSFIGGYEIPFITSTGHVFETGVSFQGDGYSVENVPLASRPEDYDGELSRFIPQFTAGWRYPLINPYGPGQSLLIEPVANFAISPNGTNDDRIPNEDSQVLEFSDTNIFSYDRFPGYDRVETGARANLGLRSQWQFSPNRYFDVLVGQNYQTNDDNAFPFTNDIDDHFSDYVGRFALDWEGWFYAAYRTRVDRGNFEPHRNEINAALALDPVFFNLDYLALDDDPYLQDREEVLASAAYNLTEYWSVIGGMRRDLDSNQMLAGNIGLSYNDECFGATANFSRDNIRDRDIEPSTSFIVRVTLKNLN
jgi:LPS-assembly protein